MQHLPSPNRSKSSTNPDPYQNLMHTIPLTMTSDPKQDGFTVLQLDFGSFKELAFCWIGCQIRSCVNYNPVLCINI